MMIYDDTKVNTDDIVRHVIVFAIATFLDIDMQPYPTQQPPINSLILN